MKIAFITETLSRDSGGMFSSLLSISKELSKKEDIKIKVFGAKNKNFIKDLSEWGDLDIQGFDIVGPKKLGYLQGLKNALREFNPDIIHNNGLWTYNSLLTTNMKKPYVISPHGMLDEWALRKSRWKKILASIFYVKKHLKKAACIHALNKEELSSIRRYGLNNDIFVIPNGVNTNISKPEMLPLWKELKKNNKNILLFLSRIDKKKGLEVLIKGFSLVSPERSKNWEIIISGGGEKTYEESIRKLIKKLKLENKIIFTGEIDPKTKNSALHYSDALILPSYSEGMPLVILEAWANKLPVIITKECNLPESFSEGAAIKISTDPTSIAEGLENLFLMNKEQRTIMGKKGYLLVQKKFNIKMISKKFLDMYKWAIEHFSKAKN